VTVVLLHDLGKPAGGARWRAAAPTDWIVPDLPGHGATPATRTGHYDPMSAVAIGRWAMAHAADEGRTTLVGVGQNAHGALVDAAGGGCDHVVIVDGLWGPWLTPREEVDAFYGMIRAIASDPAAIGAPPASGLDPRATYGYGVMVSAAFCRRLWSAIDQPALVLETPASVTPPDARPERVSWFGGPTTVVELDATDPATLVHAIRDWITTLA
jgi:pimeloyl-ACP methyl ester carboxylesterase